MSNSSSSSEREPLFPNHQHRCRFCLHSKAEVLIICWTFFIGAAYTTFLTLASISSISGYISHSPLDDVVSYPESLLYSLLAIIALFYPLIGFLADVSCGRFNVVIFSFGLVVVSYIAVCICGIACIYLGNNKVDINLLVSYAVAIIAIGLAFIGFGGYQANFIQLGLEQQISAPSEDLAKFVHWTTWAFNAGSSIITTICVLYSCSIVSNTAKIALLSILPIIVTVYLVVLIISCFKRRLFNSELRQQNPYKTIIKVLYFARKHKFPIFRSAFTFSDDEKPSRLDFAKKKFGGPFTTEQVENTKSFFKILAVLFALGPVFTMDIPSSYLVLFIFGYHAGNVHVDTNNGSSWLDHCSSWVTVWSGNLKYTSGTFLFPLYIWFVFSFLRNRIPRIFRRLFTGIILYVLGVFLLLIIDLVGHILYKHHSSSGELGSMCMFDIDKDFSPHLDMHWTVMVPPSILLGIGPLIVMSSTLEFISAQSPHFMKGLIVGLMFAIVGLFQLVGALSLLPFSLKGIWSTSSMIQNPPITNCGFGYLLFSLTVAFIGLILFVVAAKKYTYRVRDDKPYNQSQVEEIYSRYLERPVHYDY